MSENGDQSGKGREHWSGSLGFVLAAAGSAVGLGNIWKFPYITGENGGGAFVLIYLVCILLIGLPVMLCEITLGRHTQKGPVGAFNALKPKNSMLAHIFGGGMLITGIALLCFGSYGWGCILTLIGVLIFCFGWTLVGVMGVLSGFVILSFYSVVAGWTMGYIWKSVSNLSAFENVEQAGNIYEKFILDPYSAIGFHVAFMLVSALIILKGVQKGIERWSKILMPALFFILIVLILRGLSLPGASKGVSFFLTPDFAKINTNSVLQALGHAFFTLSLGMGAIITYGSYVSKKQNIFMSSLSIVGLDTLVAILAGLAIFPAVFAQGFDPEGGPGLVFKVLPVVFNTIPLGNLWAGLFFLLLFVAALTSGISLLEVVVSFAIDELKWSRRFSVVIITAIITVLGSFCAVSVVNWKHLEWLHEFFQMVFDTTQGSFFDLMDNLASNWMLPLGGLFISLFVGWVWGTRNAVNEIRNGSLNFADVHLIALLAGLKDDPSHNSNQHVLTLASLWGIFIRFISPIAVLIAFLHTIGWIKLQ